MAALRQAAELCSLLRTALGPCGRDKLVVSATGKITVTADGATLLSEMGVASTPVGNMLLSLAETHQAAAGDGTTSVIVFLGALCEAAERLIDQGAHPWFIISGFQAAVEVACEQLERLAIDPACLPSRKAAGSLRHGIDEEEPTLSAICVALGEHIRESVRLEWARTCLSSVKVATGGWSRKPDDDDNDNDDGMGGCSGDTAGSPLRSGFQRDRIRILMVEGGRRGEVDESVELIHGTALRKRFAQSSFIPTGHTTSPDTVTAGPEASSTAGAMVSRPMMKACVLSGPLEIPKLKTRGQLHVRNEAEYREMDRLSSEFRDSAVSALVSCGVEVVFCQWGIDLELCHALAMRQIAVVTWVAGPDLERVAMTLKASICPRVEDLTPDQCGSFLAIDQIQVPSNADPVLVVRGVADCCVSTILVRSTVTNEADSSRKIRALEVETPPPPNS